MAEGIVKRTAKKSSENTRTPRFYLDIANILRTVETKQTSVKGAIFNAKLKSKRYSGVYAAVCQILKLDPILEHVIAEIPVLNESILNKHVLKVVIHELIVRKCPIHGVTKPVLLALQHKEPLERALNCYLKSRGYERVEDYVAACDETKLRIPRYVRVNTLVTTFEAVRDVLVDEGFREVRYEFSGQDDDDGYEEFIEKVKRLERDEFLKDWHIENLLVFHPKQTFFQHELYDNGWIILQDKASCFPVHCLKPVPGKVAIDACAAPGMKTTLLASLMNNQGCIIAMDNNEHRAETMRKILNRSNVTCADVRVADFTTVDPQALPYRKARYILLDPSCSCSGMVSDRQRSAEDPTNVSAQRLQSLASFQVALLRHALSFPKVKRVVYSTCSIFETENENVVMEALDQFGDTFYLKKIPVGWPALSDATGVDPRLSGRCLKTIPERDLSNGFFVAVFKRRKREDKN